MTFRKRIQYHLVKKLNISNKVAIELIRNGQIAVNEVIIYENIEISETDSLKYGSVFLQEAKQLIYVAFYKPRGIETTLNTEIANNLKEILPFEESLFPVGRLDKESEGLLLLTNDGRIFDKTLRHENNIEKEYLVEVDKPISDEFLLKMASGVNILGKITKAAKLEKLTEFQFKIILTQGLNRQIRRMCYKLDYEVLKLVRIRIGNHKIEVLKPLEYRYLDKY